MHVNIHNHCNKGWPDKVLHIDNHCSKAMHWYRFHHMHWNKTDKLSNMVNISNIDNHFASHIQIFDMVEDITSIHNEIQCIHCNKEMDRIGHYCMHFDVMIEMDNNYRWASSNNNIPNCHNNTDKCMSFLDNIALDEIDEWGFFLNVFYSFDELLLFASSVLWWLLLCCYGRDFERDLGKDLDRGFDKDFIWLLRRLCIFFLYCFNSS